MKWTGSVVLLLVLATGCPANRSPRHPTTPAADHLKGDWHLVSTLGVREGVVGPSKHLLELSKQLQDVVDGKLTIDGVPKLVSGLVGTFRGTFSGKRAGR